MTPTRYPLSWPDRWARTKSYAINSSRFKDHSLATACDKLNSELDRMGATGGIISTNVPTRNDGMPRSGLSQPGDRGVSVYFKFKGRDVALACDKWNRVEDNLWAIACHIETLRSQERWGVGTLEQAFRGYMALPAATGRHWSEVLGVSHGESIENIATAYRARSKVCHPDVCGGKRDAWDELEAAYKTARAERGF